MNIGIITHDGEMVLPPFEQTLAGVTLQRLMQLVKEVSLALPCLQDLAGVAKCSQHIQAAHVQHYCWPYCVVVQSMEDEHALSRIVFAAVQARKGT